MVVANSQDSRTLNGFATIPDKMAFTWDYLHPTGTEVSCGNGAMSALGVTDQAPQVAFSDALKSVPQAAFERFSRMVTLDEILMGLRTEKGQDTFARRFRGVPQGLSPADEMEWMLQASGNDHDAEAEFSAWAHEMDRVFNISKNGSAKSFTLQADKPTQRWQTRKMWVAGVLADPRVSESAALKRMSARHLPFIVEAIAYFADGVTGADLCASQATIARRARKVYRNHPELDPRPGARGATIIELSDSTLEKNVKVVLSALRTAGWVVERARGRRITMIEKCLARVLFGITQNFAASVQDLVTPERAWVREEKREVAPAWASAGNPWMLGKVAGGLRAAALKICEIVPLPLGAQVIYITTIYYGLLKKSQAIEKHNSSQKMRKSSRFAGIPDPSKASQAITADLRKAWGWLLPKTAAGKRMDSRVIARIIDEEGMNHVSAKKIKNFVDLQLFVNRWEFNPAQIVNKLAWLRTILRDMRGETALTV